VLSAYWIWVFFTCTNIFKFSLVACLFFNNPLIHKFISLLIISHFAIIKWESKWDLVIFIKLWEFSASFSVWINLIDDSHRSCILKTSLPSEILYGYGNMLIPWATISKLERIIKFFKIFIKIK
jgi:hypothetical protein